MDESDRDITFDSDGRCNHCTNALKNYPSRNENQEDINKFVSSVRKKRRRNAKYDCVIGLSGGVDSCYLLYLIVKWGLKPLVVHVDAGWNSIESVQNIQSLVSILDVDMQTVIIDWKVMRNLHLAYLESGVLNQDVPQDHAFFANIYDVARKNRIKNVILGSNIASESILPASWGQNASDGKNLKKIFEKFNKSKLVNYKTHSIYRIIFELEIFKLLRIYQPLNLINFDKDLAKSFLINNLSFQDYGSKHSESTFTSYFQKIYLPTRMGIDKRKAHLSSLIVSGKIDRETALIELNEDPVTKSQERDLRRFVSTKLRITQDQLMAYENLPVQNHRKYGYSRYGMLLLRIIQKIGIVYRRSIK
jgi:N-acetyl sugar amidotransferase